ncbi:MAG: hypothetical protein GXY25_02190 [Pirellulaceae bacterium]|nr:hypothetical protein [Thermoguttaceae bacterium]MDI9444609.1 hypothetical protein [Planctomycetota bacterium]NLY99327.1 hypothetical protein [Pirellulaceae bacterium]
MFRPFGPPDLKIVHFSVYPRSSIGGAADHLHALCLLSRKFTTHGRHQEIENGNVQMDQETSDRGGVISNGGPVMGSFPQVSQMLSKFDSTIANQEEHHKRISFQDESRALCQRHGVTLDQRYAWD